jgi:hypothetical protein
MKPNHLVTQSEIEQYCYDIETRDYKDAVSELILKNRQLQDEASSLKAILYAVVIAATSIILALVWN